ncbi:MAG: three-Cys-motif partner protein TcmP [Candidatus Auribacterota bacterium]
MTTVRYCSNSCYNKHDNGNCDIPGKDGLSVQCVGEWVKDKFYFLESYLNHSYAAREKFTRLGNAVYIDLFAGTGKCIIKEQQEEINNGALRALNREKANFNEAYLIDIAQDNIDALSKRTRDYPCKVICDDCNTYCDTLVAELREKPFRYHFAFIDPFAPGALMFETLQKLASLDRMDMLIHFPLGSILRNYKSWLDATEDTILDRFFGSRDWRGVRNLSEREKVNFFIEFFITQLHKIGYPDKGLRWCDQHFDESIRSVSIKNTKNATMYLLILASKHELAQKLWNSVLKSNRYNQETWF